MTPPENLSINVRARLSIMMFLQYAFQGIWIIPMATFLSKAGYSDPQVGTAYGMVAIGFIIAPFIVGMIADRFFAAEKILGVLNIAAAFLLIVAAKVAVGPDGIQPLLFNSVILAHCIFYTPSWALTNTIALNQMSNPGKQFPGIRVMGTIGWICVSAISLFSERITGALEIDQNFEATSVPMTIGAAVGILAGVLSFIMPHTPPKGKGEKVTVGDILGLKALALFKDRNFAVFAVCSFLIMFAGMFYWGFCNQFLNEIGMRSVMFKQSMGQMAELVFLLIMPWFFLRLGVKKMLLIGFLAWIARFLCFATGSMNSVYVLYAGLLLHGVCFDFFFVTGQLYTDRKAPKEVQASAQGLISLLTFGVGWFVGSILAGNVIGKYPDGMRVVVDSNGYAIPGAHITQASKTAPEIVKDLMGNPIADAVIKEVHNWSTIWLYPAVIASVIMVIFMVFFKDDVTVGQQTDGDKTV